MPGMRLFPTLTVLAGAALALAPLSARADRHSDYWAPENMAKRQCTSVHLGYRPTLPAHTAAYTEVVIEKSAPGTYFAANNFSAGYIGFQQLITPNGEKGDRVAIFSIWDAKDSGDNPNAAAEEDRARLIASGEGVDIARFGGEGTGGRSMRPFAWKKGEVLRTLVIEKPDGEHFRQIAGYIHNPATGKWELMSCWRIQALTRGLGGGCGFVEDFCRNETSKQHERRATFGPAFRWADGKWHEADVFTFTKDGNPNMEINCRRSALRGYYSLATGGPISPDDSFPVFASRKLDPMPQSMEPGEDVMQLIRAPKLEAVEAPAAEAKQPAAQGEEE